MELLAHDFLLLLLAGLPVSAVSVIFVRVVVYLFYRRLHVTIFMFALLRCTAS